MINNEQLISKIHHDINFKCHVAITCNWVLNDNLLELDIPGEQDKLMYDQMYSGKKFINKANEIMRSSWKDTYFSINSFRHDKKTSDDIWHLNAFVLDFDYYKIKEYNHLNPKEMYSQNIKELLPQIPTAVIDSGRGLYVIYVFQNCPRQMISTYKEILKSFYKMFKHLGLDPKAMNLTQIIRLPGTINSKSNKRVEVIEFNDTDYVIGDFFRVLNYSREEVHLYKASKSWKNKFKKEFHPYDKEKSLQHKMKKAMSIINDLKKFIELKNESGEYEGYREYIISFKVTKRHVKTLGHFPAACGVVPSVI